MFGIGEQCKVLDEHYDDLYHILLVAWTPAGDALFFARRWLVVEGGGAVLPAFQGRYSNLYRLDVETGEVSQVIPLDERPDFWFRVAGVSPDGRWVAYHHDDEDGALYLRELDSGDERHVSDGNGDWVAGARFSPDGSHLAYVEVEGHDQPRFTGGQTVMVDVTFAGQAVVLVEGAGVVDWPVGWLDGETPILDRLDAEGHLGLWVAGESSELGDLLPGMLAGVLSPARVEWRENSTSGSRQTASDVVELLASPESPVSISHIRRLEMQLPAFLSISQVASDCAYCLARWACLGTPTPDFEFFIAALVAGGP